MKTLARYLKKRKTAIDFLLRKPSQKYTPNTFHKLRVEIKKLNSFFDLIHFGSSHFRRKKTYKPYKLIFCLAGKVRELQIEEAMLKNNFGNNGIKNYRKSLKKLRLKAEKDFFLLVDKKVKNQLIKKYYEIIPHLKSIDQKKMDTYLAKKENQIQELLGQEIIRTGQIHKLRKQLKILNYNQAIVYPEISEEKLSGQEVLPELLGKWHDCQVIIKHLKKMLTIGKLGPTELAEIKTIKPKIVLESKGLLNEIRNTLRVPRFFGGPN
ncbi:MAG TPA: CHAD domain-containing protein [Flavobacterium sp.]|nr:CHAD domain-containing protein [Flavobacterium sp.]